MLGTVPGIVAGSSLFIGYLHKNQITKFANVVHDDGDFHRTTVLFPPRFGLLIVINFLLGFAMGKLNPEVWRPGHTYCTGRTPNNRCWIVGNV